LTDKSKLACRKPKTTNALWGLASACMNHWVCNGKPVTKVRHKSTVQHAWIALTVHCLFKKKTGPSSPWLEMATHTVILGAWCNFSQITRGFWRPKSHTLFINLTIQVEVCLIRKPNIAEPYLIVLSTFSIHFDLCFELKV
jgi:hypothetical protein